MPERVQMTRNKPWRHLHPDAVIVSRPSKWGNPWRIVPVRDHGFPFGDAADVINDKTNSSVGRFERTTRTPRTGAPYWACQAYRGDLTEEMRADARRELAGRDLACWCPADQPCHADVLLEISNVSMATTREDAT